MSEEHNQDSFNDVAIIGLAVRLPGADNIDQLWQNLAEGLESISFFTDEHLPHVPEQTQANPDYVKAAGLLEDIESFDAALFGLTPMEAALTDPQQRIFIECCWQALEHAGYNPETHGAGIGLFAGRGSNAYVHHLLADPNLLDQVGQMQFSIGNEADHFTPRISYLLNLQGPSVPVQTACSTSLVAIHLACQNLIHFECDMALAGGCSLTVPKKTGYLHVEDSIFSPDGHCRPFDASAQGTVRGNGSAVVLLKRLEDAIDDGDHIHAVLKGSAINNDGAVKIGYTAPSVEGQCKVIEEVLAVTDMDPASIGYVEAHGTATALGDPIEIQALSRAYGETPARQSCALGSLKSNMGHLDAAAGVSGLIKAVLCLERKTLVPTLHYQAPNPAIDFASSPFYVNTKTRPWTSEDPRRAAVSSFGIGGTNAHAILEEMDASLLTGRSGPSRPNHLVTLSARSKTSLKAKKAELASFLQENLDLEIADVAFTLNVGRADLDFREAVICQDTASLAKSLESGQPVALIGNPVRDAVFLFPGQGTNYPDLGGDLYRGEPAFAEAVDRCCRFLDTEIGCDLADVMFAAPDSEARNLLEQPAYWQLAIFVCDYASAQLWMSWGIQPRAMMGHSIGEYVAAVLAGVLKLEDALKLVATRGRLTADVPMGAMTAVIRSEEELADKIVEPISLAANNGPNLCVLSGPTQNIEALERELAAEGVRTIRLGASHAFHSSMIEPIAEPLARLAAGFELNPPKIAYISNLTGTWITAEEATDPTYWARHLRRTVRFSQGCETLFAEEGRVFLEVGPGKVLTNLVHNHSANKRRFPTIGHGDEGYGQAQLLAGLGAAWCEGLPVNWPSFYGEEFRCRLALPTYPFDRKTHWFEGSGFYTIPKTSDPVSERKAFPDWFYIPSWRPAPYTGPSLEKALEADKPWLIFCDEGGLAEGLAQRLGSLGATVIRVSKGEAFAEQAADHFTINPAKADAVDPLIKTLIGKGCAPARIIYALGLDADVAGLQDYDNLIRLAQAQGAATTEFLLTVLTHGVSVIDQREPVAPERAAVLGVVHVLPKELAGATCKQIDLERCDLDGAGIDRLLAEIASAWPGAEVALRGRSRYVAAHESLPYQERPDNRFFTGPGKFLIINGLQEIGFSLARHLTQDEGTEAILLDRAFFPAEVEWDSWLEEQSENDPTSRQIRRFRDCNRERISVTTLNPSNSDAMRRFKQAQGPFRAIFFLSQLSEAALIQAKFAETPSSLLATRIVELRCLEQLYDGEQAVVLFTENRGESGIGYAEQAACYQVTYRFAEQMSAKNLPFSCVDWGTRSWTDVTIDEKNLDPMQKGLVEKRKLYGMSQQDALQTLDRLLPWGLSRTVISTRDYEPVLAQLDTYTAAFFQEQFHKLGGGAVSQERPELSEAYVPPSTETETFLADQWGYFFGIDKLGINDNFFELGGNSLLAVQMLTKVTEKLGIEVSAEQLFEMPSIAVLGAYIDEQLRGEVEDDEVAALLAEIEGLSEEETLALLEPDD